MMTRTIEVVFDGEQSEQLKKHVEELVSENSLDTSDPEQYARMLEGLSRAEASLIRTGGQDSELAVRRAIHDASAIFVHGSRRRAR